MLFEGYQLYGNNSIMAMMFCDNVNYDDGLVEMVVVIVVVIIIRLVRIYNVNLT